jgi:hypothetical protein
MDQPQQPANEDQVLRPLAADFDRDPERFAANQLVSQKFAIFGDVHDQVVDRLAKITSGPILDLGGGNGSLGQAAKLADSCVLSRSQLSSRSTLQPIAYADAPPVVTKGDIASSSDLVIGLG